MKPTIVIFLLLLCFNPIQAQKYSGSLSFNGGRTANGLVQVKRNKISFRPSKKAQQQVYDYNQVHSVTYGNRKSETLTYEYVALEHETKPQLFQVIVNGKIKLYLQLNSNFSMADGMGNYNNTSTYYIKKDGEECANIYAVFDTNPKTSFKHIINAYFKDCVDLINRVDRKEFTKSDFKEIIEFYNASCGDTLNSSTL